MERSASGHQLRRKTVKQYLIMALLCGAAAFGAERVVFRSAPAQTADTAATSESEFAGTATASGNRTTASATPAGHQATGTATATTGNRMTERSTGGSNRPPYRKPAAPPAANPPPGGSDAYPRTDSGFAGAPAAHLDGRIVYRDAAGRTTGTAEIHGGATTYRDAAGKVTGTAKTFGNTTTYRDAFGRLTGTATAHGNVTAGRDLQALPLAAAP